MNDIERTKKYILKHPEMFLVKNKHKLNLKAMLAFYPELKEIPEETLYEVFKRVVNFDREARKAKEELLDEHLIERNLPEMKQKKLLEKAYQKKLGYIMPDKWRD